MRTNNGGELRGKEFDQFCKKCGITHQNTTPYTPHQNVISERMNKTLMDKERSMFSGVGLAQEFWVEVVDTTKYLLNMYYS
jgi:transposase InsO family protein